MGSLESEICAPASPAGKGTKVLLEGLCASQTLATGPQVPRAAGRKQDSPGKVQGSPDFSLGVGVVMEKVLWWLLVFWKKPRKWYSRLPPPPPETPQALLGQGRGRWNFWLE